MFTSSYTASLFERNLRSPDVWIGSRHVSRPMASHIARKPSGVFIRSKLRNHTVPCFCIIARYFSAFSVKWAIPAAFASAVATTTPVSFPSNALASRSSSRYFCCHSATSMSDASHSVGGQSGSRSDRLGFFAGASLAGRISSAIALSSVVRVARTAADDGAPAGVRAYEDEAAAAKDSIASPQL